MVIGATGTGKSTTISAILRGAENMYRNIDGDVVTKNIIKYNGDEVFQIGHEVLSCTQEPSFLKQDDIYFVDCPGLQDQDIKREYPNQTSVHFVQKRVL